MSTSNKDRHFNCATKESEKEKEKERKFVLNKWTLETSSLKRQIDLSGFGNFHFGPKLLSIDRF